MRRCRPGTAPDRAEPERCLRHHPDRAQYDRATRQSLDLKHGRRYVQRREPYFFDYMQEQLIERYGVGVVRRGGLSIHTTIDPKMQDQARAAINSYYGDPSGPSRS